MARTPFRANASKRGETGLRGYSVSCPGGLSWRVCPGGFVLAGLPAPAPASRPALRTRRLTGTGPTPHPSRYPLRWPDRRDLRGRSPGWMRVDVTPYQQEQGWGLADDFDGAYVALADAQDEEAAVQQVV